MKILDCFIFYNEYDLLELRLKELYQHVDVFVIVEGNLTHQSVPKPWNLENNWDRYHPWADKIRYVKIADMPGGTNPWANEIYQRDAVIRGITESEEVMLIIGDLDEIPRIEVVDYLRQNTIDTLFFLRMPHFNFKLNYMQVNGGYGITSMAIHRAPGVNVEINRLWKQGWRSPESHDPWKLAADRSALVDFNEFRRSRSPQFPLGYHDRGICVIEHAGWHFSYLGNQDFVVNKINNFSHAEYRQWIDQVDVEASLKSGKGPDRNCQFQFQPVLVDDYFPKIITDPKYQPMILKAEVPAMHYLPKHKSLWQ